jgi:hypothetical protein
MIERFSDMGVREAREIIRKDLHPLTKSNRLFVEGDHFQNGSGWVGPAPRLGERGYQEALSIIKQGFTSKNIIAEVTERHAAGIVGREPSWSLSPVEGEDPESEELQELISEAERLLTVWWDKRGVPELIMSAITTLLWSSRASIRLYIPAGFVSVDEDTGESVLQEPGTIEEALEMIYPEHPDPEQSTVHQDPDTKRFITIYAYKRGRKDYVELSYLDEGGEETVLRTISRDSDEVFDPLPLGGRLLMHEMRRPLLITEQVQQGQKAVNLAISTIPRTVVTAGWLERTLLNAQMPGQWTKDPDTGEERFVPAPYRTGPNTTNFVQGIEYRDEKGATVISNPSIHHRDPVPATSAIEAKTAHYRDILEEVDQPHVMMASDATASARSRVEARGDYLNSLRITNPRVESMGRWLLETVLSLAEALTGAPGKYTDRLRAVFRTRLDVGHLSPEEQRMIQEQVEKGLMPREWAMEMMGIDDVDSAIDLMDTTPDSRLGVMKKRLENMKLATEAGMSLQTAAELVEFDEEALEIIQRPRNPVEDEEVLEP